MKGSVVRRRQRYVQVLLASVFFAAAATAEDWPQFRGPRGDGTWQGLDLPAAWPESGLKVHWRKPIGGGYAGIAVVGDRLFTLDRQTEPVERERVLCLDTASGEIVWQYEVPVTYGSLDYGNGPRCTPTVHDGRVYTVGALGHVACLDAATGKVIWTKDYRDDFGGRLPTWGYAGSAVIHRDVVLLAPGGPDAGLVALDRVTGKERWRSLTDEAGYCTPLVVSFPTGERIFHWTPSHIRGVDFATGKPLWGIPYEITYGVSIAKPIFQENLLLVAGYWHGSKAVRVNADNPTSAELAWEENRYLRGLMSQPLYRDGYVYLLDKQYGLTCFELATGKKLWDDRNTATPRDRNPQLSLVWLGETDRALILNADGELILARLTPEKYEEISRVPLIGFTWAHPAFAGTSVYARSDTEIVGASLIDETDMKSDGER